VRDAKESITISVSARDVSGGRAKDHKNCPIAGACKRGLPIQYAIISKSTAYIVDKNMVATRYLVSGGAREELISFDRGGSFQPGEYSLYAPTARQKLGSTHKRERTQGDGSRPRLVRKINGLRASIVNV
jgi:hypothetical protein